MRRTVWVATRAGHRMGCGVGLVLSHSYTNELVSVPDVRQKSHTLNKFDILDPYDTIPPPPSAPSLTVNIRTCWNDYPVIAP
jgi:hypothetical protein